MSPNDDMKIYRHGQPEITVVNLNCETSPSIFRVNHDDISAPATLIRLARFLEAEEAIIVNLSLSPTHLCLVTTLKDNWIPRFQRAVREGWEPAQTESGNPRKVEEATSAVPEM